MFYRIAIMVFVILILTKYCVAKGEKEISYSDFLAAIRQVESGNNENAIGDKGEAIGVYQIHYSYWLDAVRYDKTIGGKYEDCKKLDYSTKIVKAYFDKYAKQAVQNHEWEKISRIHNGGPNGWQNKSTEIYWIKIKRILDKL